MCVGLLLAGVCRRVEGLEVYRIPSHEKAEELPTCQHFLKNLRGGLRIGTTQQSFHAFISISTCRLPVCACWFIYTLFNVNKQSKWSSTLVEETYSRPVISKLPWCHTMPPSARWRNQPPGKWHVTYSMKQGHPWISLPPGAMLPSTVTQCVSSVTLNDCTFKVSNLRGCLYTLEILSVDVVCVTSDITWVGVDGLFLPY